jgi:predicted DNA-binding ribbon-helix-helix protein
VTSLIVKRSIVIAGHKTSVSVEDAFWTALKDIATSRGATVAELVATIDAGRRHGNLSSAIRLFVLDYFRNPPSGNGAGERAQGKVAATAVGSTPPK